MNCSFDGCTEEALFSYVWAWGENGVCCERHRFILGQQSQRLQRAVTITPLDPGAPKPVTRDERIGYHARVMALEAELQEVQGRGATLSEGVSELKRQLRTSEAQKAALESELQSHRERVADLSGNLAASQQAAAKAQGEVERLTRRLAIYEVDGDPLPDLDMQPLPAHTAR